MKKFISILLCVSMLLGCLAGCGSKSTTTTTPAATTTEPAASTTTDITQSTEVGTDVGTGNVTKEDLVIAMASDVSSLDPMKCWDGVAYYLYWILYNRLIYLNPETNEYEPELAESWAVSDDGLVYTFNLRKGVKWHDGSDFTAKDVKYSVERGVELSTGCYPDVDHVEIIDDYTVELHMAKANSVFMDYQWTGDCAILKEGSGDEIGLVPNGTGPFKFVEWVPADHITVEAFDDFWGESSGTKTIRFQIIPEANARLVALQAGDIDVAVIDAAAISHVVDDSNLELLTNTSVSIKHLNFNNNSEALANKTVRQALAYAIDREGIVEVELNGQGAVQESMLAPGKMGSLSSFDYSYEYNPEKAKELLAEAGYANGLELTLATTGTYKLSAQMIQSNLADVGVTLKINEVESSVFTQTCKEGGADMFLRASSGGNSFFYLKRFLSTNSNNFSKYVNEEYDAKLNASCEVFDMDERNAMYEELQTILHDDMPCLPLYVGTVLLAVNKNIKNVRADVEGCHDFRSIYYEE